jgi:1-acyl-sn-glycerol-3-phosphate acyltransferase
VLRTLYAWTIGAVTTLFWSTLGIVTWPFSPRGDLYLVYARIWSRGILASLGIPITVEGGGSLDRERTYLFMSNHESTAFDIFALFVAIDHGFRMIAKKSLFFIPILGWSLAMCGFIPIDRSNRGSAIRSLRKAANRMREGVSLLVFPEGTRGPGGGELLPFKKGAFHLALQAGVPIVPVVVIGTDTIMTKGSIRVGHGKIRVRIGEPIELEGRDVGREELMAEVRAAMVKLRAGAVAGAAVGT